MAALLYRLGRFSARRAWLVVGAWVTLLALAAVAFVVGHGTLSSAVTIPGTATAQVTDQLREKFPAASGGSGTVVFHTADGSALTDDQKQAISTALAGVAKLDGVRGVTDPFQVAAQGAAQAQQIQAGKSQVAAAQAQLAQAPQVDPAAKAALDAQGAKLDQAQALLEMASGIRTVSSDGSAAVGIIAFDGALQEIPQDVKQGVVDHLEAADLHGASVELSSELTQSLPEVLGAGEVIGVVIAGITLLVMLGTLVAAGLPILSALVGVGFGVMGTLALSGTVDMLSVTPVLGVMLGLAVGIDYSLFIVNRHRHQLRAGIELHESIGLANGTSGNAVLFAGSTVLVALLALNVTGIPFLGMMGDAAAFCVATAIAVAVTLTPALLSLIGMRVLPKRHRGELGEPGRHRPATRPMKTGRAVWTLLAGVAALVVLAVPALSMRLGLPDGSTEPQDSTQHRAFSIVETSFGAGMNGPLLVVADLPKPVTGDALTAEQVRIGTVLKDHADVVAVAPVGASKDGTVLAFQVIPKGSPNSKSTEDLVRDLRDLSPIHGDGGDVTVGVAGSASGNIDVSEKLAAALPVYLAVVVGLSFIIMVLVFRSLLVPLTATLGFVMSLFASLGGVVAIFQWGWLEPVFHAQAGPILSFLPTLLVGILFGLAMDYQLFLVSGMREAYVHGAPARVAVREGLSAGRTVVTAAAIIMISVFSGFVFSDNAIIRPLGFGLAFGVAVDAFLVRMLVIPAVMHLAGDAAWWLPRWLDRILPNVDVEGAELERTHPHPVTRFAEPVEVAAATGS